MDVTSLLESSQQTLVSFKMLQKHLVEEYCIFFNTTILKQSYTRFYLVFLFCHKF